MKNIRINTLSKKSKYLINKIYKLRVIFKKENNSLVFNI